MVSSVPSAHWKVNSSGFLMQSPLDLSLSEKSDIISGRFFCWIVIGVEVWAFLPAFLGEPPVFLFCSCQFWNFQNLSFFGFAFTATMYPRPIVAKSAPLWMNRFAFHVSTTGIRITEKPVVRCSNYQLIFESGGMKRGFSFPSEFPGKHNLPGAV